jgi:anti-sigma B factor antagonist
MSFSIHTRSIGQALVMDMKGRLECGKPVDALRLGVRDGLRSGCRLFVFNLAGVDRIDSSGLGVLTEVAQTIESLKGAVRMAALTKRVDDLLVITKLATVFKTYPDEAQAIASLLPSTL